MKTYTPKAAHITRNWHVIDAKGQVLGRVSTQIASYLMGKNKTYFVSHLDCGDYVVVINAKDVQVTGNKLLQKVYYHHTNFPGGLRSQNLRDRLQSDPTKVIQTAVKGMLPKNKLQSVRLNRLKIFADDQHPYSEKINDQSTQEQDNSARN